MSDRPGAGGTHDGRRDRLHELVQRLDGQSFSRYRELIGRHELGEFELHIDRVPPDPFAGGAYVRLSVDREAAKLPADLTRPGPVRLGVEAYLAGRTSEALRNQFGDGKPATPGSGHVFIEPFGPAVLERSVCRVTERRIELRLFVDLPAARRRIRGWEAATLFLSALPRLATTVLLFPARAVKDARAAAESVCDHVALQEQLPERGLVAFVGDGSLLARAGGDETGPRRDGREVAFRSPEALAVELDLPHAGKLRGMGIPAGVTLIVGGGFHGKSTLVDAIAAGVHPHLAADGRAQVAAIPEAVSVRAEDGRSVRGVDISCFLGDLPSGVRSSDFSTERASGSTSQASSIIEALEAGARLLLLDEDRSATNFMIRDGRMQRLVPRPGEPIVPFLDRVRDLYDRFGLSTILVTGGSGDYLEVADTVIRMDAYQALDVTREAREIVATTRSMRLDEPVPDFERPVERVPGLGGQLKPHALRSAPRGRRAIRVGDETVSLDALDQLVESGQVRALGRLMRQAAMRMGPGKTMPELLDEIEARLDADGLDPLDPPASFDLSRPRRFELAAALNRWRSLAVRRGGSDR